MNTATYLLLRNNKESGPFSLQQLKEMGMKPYDLIWVQGRSAAWRYSGEIDELKAFAPIVEEQPFDRFYKKPEENKEKHFYEIIEEAENIKTNKISSPGETLNFEKQKITTKKVYISMPEHPVTRSLSLKIKETSNEKDIKQTEDAVQTEIPGLVSEKTESALNSFKSQYSKTHQTRKQKIDRKRNTKRMVELSLAPLFLLILGTFIFLNFKPGDKMPIANSVPEKNDLIKTNSSPDFPENTHQDLARDETTTEVKDEAPIEVKKVSPVLKKNVETELKSTKNKSEPVTEEINSVSSKIDMEGSRIKSVRDNSQPLYEKPANISGYVSVKANEYKRRSFGGIENLQLTVVNSSGFTLEKVIVELQYLKPSELPLKTEKIEFNSIAPNGSMTLKIPDSPRGIKVLYKITQVVLDQYDKNAAGL